MRYTEFGIQARAVMLRKGIKVKDVAKELGVSSAYINDLLRGLRDGNRRNGLNRKAQIARFLGMDENLANQEEAVG